MPNVQAVEAKGDKAAMLVMDDGTRVWTPEKEKADPLVGKPIPSDWTMKEGDYGPQAFPPRDKKGFGGGATAYRNTKEGQATEQDSIHRSVALTQAVQMTAVSSASHFGVTDTLQIADSLYEWLRSSSQSAGVPGTLPPAAPASPSVKAEAVSPGAGALGEAAPAPGSHTHDFQRIPNVTKWEKCSLCPATREKEKP